MTAALRRVGWGFALALLLFAGWLVWTVATEDWLPTPAEPGEAADASMAASSEAEGAAIPVAPDKRETVETAVVESGVAVRLIRRPRLDLPEGRPGDVYAALRAEAEAGNALAQYRLGSLLYDCREVPANADQLAADIEAIHQTRRRGRWDVESPAAEIATLRHRFAQCDGIPAEARIGFRDWLKASADAGVLEAQLNLPMRLPVADYCEHLAECTPEMRARQEALQAEAIDYTTQALEAGSVAALWTVAGWHAGGEVLPQNEIEAYAHFRALDQIHAAANLTPRFDRLLAGLRARLRPIDIDLGEARARALLSNPRCCVITP